MSELKDAYGTWSLTRIEQQGVSFEKRSELGYLIEDTVLHVIITITKFLNLIGYQLP